MVLYGKQSTRKPNKQVCLVCKIVAIKEFKETDEDESTKRTIQREIKMLKMLKGDHVVGIREAFKKKGKIYLIFEFFPGNLLNLIEVDTDGLQVLY